MAQPSEDDLALFRPALRPSTRVARRAVDATIKAARADGRLPTGDCIEVAMLRGLADRLDWLRSDEDPKIAYAEATVQRQLLEALRTFGLVEERRATAADLLDALRGSADEALDG